MSLWVQPFIPSLPMYNGAMGLHLRHLHLRKRMAKTLEPYPASTVWKRIFDKIVLGAGILGPIMSFPQIILIYGGHDASGVSPITFLSWAILNVPFLFYGLIHREVPIFTTYILWLICNTMIFVGAILYG